MKMASRAGDMKMAPVPSVVDLCVTALQRYGTKTFEEIVTPTLALLDAGDEDWASQVGGHATPYG